MSKKNTGSVFPEFKDKYYVNAGSVDNSVKNNENV